MLSTPSQFVEGGEKEGQFWSVFFPSLTAMVGFWATLSLNIPDFTRYAKSQRDQVLGQFLGLPTTMTLFAFISVAVTSATTVIFAAPDTGALHEPVWDPTILAGMIGAETTNDVTIRQIDGTAVDVRRVDIKSLKSLGMSFMPEGLEFTLDVPKMADLLAYLDSVQ